MIITALLTLIGLFLNGILAILSHAADVGDIPLLTNAVATVASLYAGLALIFPFSTMWAIIAIDIGFEAGYFVYKGIRWAYRKIPGIS